ncbi:MAG: endonuclease/exonuclease/phosphatase family protein, partial [Aeromonas sp.]
MAITDARAQVVAISETWLREPDQVPNYITERYSTHRQDRMVGNRGGGVLIMVSGDIDHRKLDAGLNKGGIEAMAVMLNFHSKAVLLACIYRSPCSTAEEDAELLKLLDGYRALTQQVVLIGDFNMPEIDWALQEAHGSRGGELFLSWIQDNGMYQHIASPTRYRGVQVPSLLDLILTTIEEGVHMIEHSTPLGCSDHMVIRCAIRATIGKIPAKLIRSFSKLDVKMLIQQARCLNWLPVGFASSIEERWRIIKENLQYLQDEFAPLIPRRLKKKPQWWKPQARRAIQLRNRKFWKYKISGNYWEWQSYKRLRNQAVQIQRKLKENFELRLVKRVKTEPKRFYSYVQSKKAARNTIGVLNIGGNEIATSDSSKAEAFRLYFQSVYHRDEGFCIPNGCPDSSQAISSIRFSNDLVGKLLSTLKRNKSPGPDGIYSEIIRPLADLLKDPVSELFRESLDTGIVPKDWRQATVVAIHKSGSKESVENYRPVSLTSLFSKVMERIVRDHICSHLSKYCLLSNSQHGFREKRSCLSNLLGFLELITQRLDNGHPVEVC